MTSRRGMGRFLLGIMGGVIAVGCSAKSAVTSADAIRSAATFPMEDKRLPPNERIARISKRVRGGGDEVVRVEGVDARVGRVAAFQAKYDGVAALLMPPAVRMGSAWEYVALGKDFEAVGDQGGAARAYWAAIELTNRSVGSRPQREKVRVEAFDALARIAAARRQEKWAALLEFCQDLGKAYLNSSDALEDQANFENQVADMTEGLGELERAKKKANSALAASFAGAMGNIATGAVVGGTAGSYYQVAALRGLGEGMLRSEGIMEEVSRALVAAEPGMEGFRSALGGDLEELTAGSTFAGNAVVFYLATTDDAGPYMKVLREFAVGKPRLEETVGRAGNGSITREDLIEIGKRVQEIELFVARYERRGESAPSELGAIIWR